MIVCVVHNYTVITISTISLFGLCMILHMCNLKPNLRLLVLGGGGFMRSFG